MGIRKPDWVQRLDDVLWASYDKEFKWGEFDCALFSCDCIYAMTGIDPAENLRGKYRSERGAYSQLRKYAKTLPAAINKICKEYGFEKLHNPFFASRGDAVIVKNGKNKLVGIVESGKIWTTAQEKGIISLPFEPIIAWRV